ncbi:MAG: hypothetical protein CVU42_03690 [Chloroflexi bacterium HGW-Chloroflexi-4]|jgi:hypothetical protein|nr:MAG: hypothetical protein CVU42_03690 [Chloroflexi bacterium HGW-Chloroflexi-4]
MATLLTDVNSVLGLEIGSVQTRAVLFDVVEEAYQFLASGSAPTTCGEPTFDVMPGVIAAIRDLQEITGRFFLDLNNKLIIPSHGGVEGVDRLLITLSWGPDVDVVTYGLLNELSLETANRLARSLPLNIADSFSINDRRSTQVQMDALLAAKPRILIFAGGSDRGATRTVSRIAGKIATSLHLFKAEDRPKVLFCGNRAMARRVKEVLEKETTYASTTNIRPEIENEDLIQASFDLNQLVIDEKMHSINGLERIAAFSNEKPQLTGIGFQRVIRFLGKQYDPLRKVLGIDLGSAHVTASYAGYQESQQITLPIGTGYGLEKALEQSKFSDFEKWLPEALSESQVMDYLWQKTLFPNSLPVSETDLMIELAYARHLLCMTMRELEQHADLVSRSFEPILVGGSILTHAATPWQMLTTLLDGIQPVGISPLVVDKHGILSLLGAAAKTNPLLPVQVLESTAFISLATVVSVESKGKPGTVILKARLQTVSGKVRELVVKQGELSSLPLAFGETGMLLLKPEAKLSISDIEVGKDPIKVRGGVCGLVFDTRGRPLELPKDQIHRLAMLDRWSKPANQ